jgi:hypothetical protein
VIRKFRLPGADQWLQYLVLLMTAFMIVYMVTYVQNERVRSDCREAVDRALIESITARGGATEIREDALDRLVDGLLDTPTGDAASRRKMLEDFRDARRHASEIRTDNPLPSPTCE